MGNYFDHIISKLTINDMSILGVLADNQANVAFKAMRKKDVFDQLKMSEANFRKSLYRLEANQFIEVDTVDREHKLYITEYGQIALNQSLEEEEV